MQLGVLHGRRDSSSHLYKASNSLAQSTVFKRNMDFTLTYRVLAVLNIPEEKEQLEYLKSSVVRY